MKILFLLAHPDDEAYGPYGTIVKRVREGHDVYVFTLCNGERPGANHVSSGRINGFKQNCDNAGARWKIWDFNDLTLEVGATTNLVNDIINNGQFDVVYTHHLGDLNRDHRIIAEASTIACRPKPSCTVKELYFFEIPGSTDWASNQGIPFIPSTYVSIDDDIARLKTGALARYDTETYEFPDARSVDAMQTLMKYRGYQSGTNHAEAFKLVFARD